nr:hypothetical protein Iba_chr04aCG11180 [Ipomoea batatas]
MIEAQICICSWGKRETNAAIAAKNKRFRVAPPGYGSIISMPESLESRKDGEDIIRASRNAQINLTRKHSSAYKHLYLFLGQERNQRRHSCKEPEIPGRPARIRLDHLNARKPRKSVFVLGAREKPAPPWLQRTGDSGSPRQDKARSSQCPKVGKDGEDIITASRNAQINLTRKLSSAYKLEKPAPPWLQRTGDSGSPHQDTARSVFVLGAREKPAPPWLQRTGDSGSPRQDKARSSQCPKVGKDGEDIITASRNAQINLTRKHSSAYKLEKPAPPWLQRTGDSGSPHQDTARGETSAAMAAKNRRFRVAPPGYGSWRNQRAMAAKETGDSRVAPQDNRLGHLYARKPRKFGKVAKTPITTSRNPKLFTRKHYVSWRILGWRTVENLQFIIRRNEIMIEAQDRVFVLGARRRNQRNAIGIAKNKRFRVAPQWRNQRRHGCKEPEIPGRPTRIRLGHLYARKPRKLEKMAKTPSQPQEIPN